MGPGSAYGDALHPAPPTAPQGLWRASFVTPQGRQASRSVTNALADQVAVPAIQAEMVLIQTIAGDEWRNDVTLGMLGVELGSCWRRRAARRS